MCDIAPLTSSVFALCISQPTDLNSERGNFLQAGEWRQPLPLICVTHPQLTPTTCYKGKSVRYFGSITQAGSCTSHTRHFSSTNQIFPASANKVDLILVPVFQNEEFFQTFYRSLPVKDTGLQLQKKNAEQRFDGREGRWF